MGEVKEGFLCPICMSDLGDVLQLQLHFEERHAKEDPAILKGLKDLFGKAKSKILNQDQGSSSSAAASAPTDLNQDLSSLASTLGQGLLRGLNGSSANSASLGDIDPGSGIHRKHLEHLPSLVIVDHTEDFKRERRKRLDRNKSTYQVISFFFSLFNINATFLCFV